MKEFLKGFLKGHLVWMFLSIFIGVILCFITKDIPNDTAASFLIFIVGSLGAYILQEWYRKEFNTTFDFMNFGIAEFFFIITSLGRSLL